MGGKTFYEWGYDIIGFRTIKAYPFVLSGQILDGDFTAYMVVFDVEGVTNGQPHNRIAHRLLSRVAKPSTFSHFYGTFIIVKQDVKNALGGNQEDRRPKVTMLDMEGTPQQFAEATCKK